MEVWMYTVQYVIVHMYWCKYECTVCFHGCTYECTVCTVCMDVSMNVQYVCMYVITMTLS